MIMKSILLTLGVTVATVSSLSAQAAVGSIATDKKYAVFSAAGALSDSTLYAHAGKVVVAYYYAPW